MNHFSTISVVIPSNHEHKDLFTLIKLICLQSRKPDEIIIVDSLNKNTIDISEIHMACNTHKINLIYKKRNYVFPGEARNIGLELCNSEFIAFIDVKTLPRSNWLESSLRLLLCSDIKGVWGSTIFCANSFFEKLIRDSFYGQLPVKTLPGSVFKREVYIKAGYFINWVRAGEDTEWMLRVKMLRIPVILQKGALIDYKGLIGVSKNILLNKWIRNYRMSQELSHHFPQKLLSWLVVYPLLVLIAFNWNYLIADWRTDSPLYISHITKLVAILPITIYVFFRGILFPLKRGVGVWEVLPCRFLAITLICFIADCLKLLAFSMPNNNEVTPKKRTH